MSLAVKYLSEKRIGRIWLFSGETMRLNVILTIWLFTLTGLFAQQGLRLQYNAFQVLSSLEGRITGGYANPNYSPYPARLFSFTSRVGETQRLFIFDIPNDNVREVRVAEAVSAENSDLQLSSSPFLPLYNAELDWRPELDEQGRQWFAFVSTGAEENHDIFLGVIGGENYYRLTNNASIDMMPRWSPDGNSLAFISYRSGDGDIYLLKNMNKYLEKADAGKLDLVQVTTTPLEETDIDWNPGKKADLLAFAKRENFVGRETDTYQIRVADMRNREFPVYTITDDPLFHYSRPMWDRQTGRKLLYAGKSILANSTASLYLSELTWGDDNKLQNRILEGYKTEVMKNVRMSNTEAIWLSGAKAILCQENNRLQNNPVYSVHIRRWLDKEEGAVNYFDELHTAFPNISEMDENQGNLLFITREGDISRLFIAKIEGESIDWETEPQYTLVNPGSERTFFASPLFWAGGALTAGAAAAAVLLLQNDDAGGGSQSIAIGRPPSTP